jgi:hypothetical protein
LVLPIAKPSIAAQPSAKTCDAGAAETATVHEIARGGDAQLGRCVAVTAVMSGYYLYGGLDGVYGPKAAIFDPSSTGDTLGLDFGLAKYPHPTGYQKVVAIGRVQDCQQTRDLAHSSDTPTQFVMVTGYCHFFNGTYLWVTGLKIVANADWERQLRSDSHPDYGNLVEAPADWPYRSQVQEFADRFIDALQRKDGKALVALHSPEPGIVMPNLPNSERTLLRLLIHDSTSPFVAVGRRPGKPQTMILLDRGYSEGDRYRSVICFCRGNDCTGRWPIDRRDADNLPSRPYACTELTPYILYPRGETTVFITQKGAYGLREPPAH